MAVTASDQCPVIATGQSANLDGRPLAFPLHYLAQGFGPYWIDRPQPFADLDHGSWDQEDLADNIGTERLSMIDG